MVDEHLDELSVEDIPELITILEKQM